MDLPTLIDETLLESSIFFAMVMALVVIGLCYRRLIHKEQTQIEIEQRYLNLLEISEDLIWTVDREGIITQINEASWSILGLTPEEIIGKPLISYVPEEEQPRTDDAFKELIDGGSWRNFITPLVSIDSRQINLSFNAIPTRDKKGHITGATGTASNITEQMRSLEVLRQKEHRYRQMFEQNQAIKLILDSNNGNIVEANSAALAYYGYPDEQLIGMNINTLFKAPDNEGETPLKKLIVEQSPLYLMKQLLASGETRDAEIHAGPIGIEGQRLLYLIIHDVTERLSSERALRDNEEKLRGIVEAADEGIIMVDSDGKIQFFNPAAQSIFGYPAEKIIGEEFVDLLDPQFLHQNDISPQSDINSWLPTIAGTACEIVGRRMNGDNFPLSLSLSVVKINDSDHYVALIQDHSESQQNAERLSYLAQHDVLTGLLNRREFERRLDLRLATPDSADEALALCYIDVDNFGVINNTCGQTAGNDLLQQLSTLIKTQVSEAKFIGRLGGDEFALLLDNCSTEQAEQLCNTLLQTIKSFTFTCETQPFDISISIGLTGFRPANETVSSVLSAAHIACNMAKKKGLNQLHIYHAGDIGLIKQYGDMRLISRITQALNEGRFQLLAQPIAPLNSTLHSNYHHYEILVEMQDEKGRAVSPEKFIHAAERFILMPAIDRWVVSNLFSRQGDNLRAWNEQNIDDKGFLFAVNLSGTSLADSSFLKFLERQFTQHHIPYQSICFEITETAAVANMDQAKRLIKHLSQCGCRFALDDFGTGLSSYTYLKNLPVDYLKIDGSFVRNITTDTVDQAMVSSINQVGHALGLRTIAEWAEDQETLERLMELGVDYAQGYGVGKPQPIAEIKLSWKESARSSDSRVKYPG